MAVQYPKSAPPSHTHGNASIYLGVPLQRMLQALANEDFEHVSAYLASAAPLRLHRFRCSSSPSHTMPGYVRCPQPVHPHPHAPPCVPAQLLGTRFLHAGWLTLAEDAV
jgi:hypothetical protein